jgi:esterase/lipase superfamily enzyme
VETPKWWSLYPKTDKERFVVLADVQRLQQAQFNERLSAAIAAEDSGGDLLVFIHGYNVTFEDAARRAAQLSYDLRMRGVVILFSWPSLGRNLGYWADEDRAAASAIALANFLQSLAQGSWRRIHVMAHSMGSRVLLHGLADNPLTNVALGQIIFVAADVFVDVFRQRFINIPRTGHLVTSYVSKADRALWFSNLMHRASRVGFLQTEPFVMDGLETIDASWVNTSVLGHSYYGDERTVINDVGYLVREGFPAARRGLQQMPGKRYWNFAR